MDLIGGRRLRMTTCNLYFLDSVILGIFVQILFDGVKLSKVDLQVLETRARLTQQEFEARVRTEAVLQQLATACRQVV